MRFSWGKFGRGREGKSASEFSSILFFHDQQSDDVEPNTLSLPPTLEQCFLFKCHKADSKRSILRNLGAISGDIAFANYYVDFKIRFRTENNTRKSYEET